MIPWWNTEIGGPELECLKKAFADRRISQGKLTAEFEDALANRLGVPHVVCTNSGTTALTMAFLACGVGPGDEVVVPNRTWIATANAALMLGAKVLVVDSRLDPDCMLMDEDLIREVMTPLTKVIVPVSLNGRAVRMDKVEAAAGECGAVVVEDACQALFSSHNGRFIGTSSRFACFSLGMTKLITTGAGGFIACQDEADAETLRAIRYQGMPGQAMDNVWGRIGGGFKYTDIQAAIGLAQLERVDDRREHMRALHRLYADGLAEVPYMKLFSVEHEAGEVPNKAVALCTEPEVFRVAMEERDIAVLEQAPNVADYPFVEANPADYPNSALYPKHNIVLPSGPDQPLENAEKAIEAILGMAGDFRSWNRGAV